jgi:hypothetical protein
VLAFCAFTAALTWPYVTRLRDAVASTSDPYLAAWVMWWDYHQTFRDPLNLFHANIFYPYRYTLAFSEHCYGLSLPFFPLFALGFRPLTVHAVAVFFGFALSGYGAFRLARTLTGSYGVAWVAGIIFAFTPYRFNLMAQVVYLFSVWIPLLFEALVLFARRRSHVRAAWLGFAFFMTGLTSISWFLLSLVPLATLASILLTRYRTWREREFWQRGAIALGAASLALTPFMLPYYIVSKMYGFKRGVDEINDFSARPIHWLVAEGSNKLWRGMGGNIPYGFRFPMFPGLLTLLLPLAELLPRTRLKTSSLVTDNHTFGVRWVRLLDILVVVGLSLLALGWYGTQEFAKPFLHHITSERTLAFLSLVVITRLSISYPRFLLRGEGANLIETIRSDRRSDAFWFGILLTVIGFSYSIGWNFFFYRILYDVMPGFKSMRAPMRGAMFAYLGLALLAGLGVKRVAEQLARRRGRAAPAAMYACVCALLLLELNAAPLHFVRGDVFPDAVTMRLKETPMSGGIVVLPIGSGLESRPTLRAADHAKPLIVGMSGFKPPYEIQIEQLTGIGPITSEFLDLLDRIPASYLVVQTNLLTPERRTADETFLVRSVASGRLRFINRFDGSDDLYAVAKTEPESRSEAALPFSLPERDWESLVQDDPINILGLYQRESQKLFRVHIASFGGLPRYADFVRDVREVGRGVVPGFEEENKRLVTNFREFVDGWVHRRAFSEVYDGLTDAQYVIRLYTNAGLDPGTAECAALTAELSAGHETRSGVLLRVVEDPSFLSREENRSLVLLHYFGYLRRNPDDPPDNNLDGMLFWIHDIERTHDRARISRAFLASRERVQLEQRTKK